mmetsp:Transcript_13912/g.18565  ORF Transcript_13912/g.18565 Transcript_13912/m.18565 type:complete len:295 (+) Transcript_13912:136-1020(+)
MGDDSMPDDSILIKKLQELVDCGDESELTARQLREALEKEYGIDLNEKKEWIKDQVKGILADKHGAVEEEEVKGAEIIQESGENEGEVGGEMIEGDPADPLLDEDMASVCGVRRANHFTCVKYLWQYIKKHNLQNPESKNQIICDDKLRKLFNVDQVSSFGMSKLIGAHIIKGSGTPGAKAKRKSKAADGEDGAPKAKKTKTPSTSSKPKTPKEPAPYTGSKELTEFLGEEIQNRFVITKKLWAYIKENNLQDPNNRRTINCDEKLRALFGLESFDSFKMATLLALHFPKKNTT